MHDTEAAAWTSARADAVCEVVFGAVHSSTALALSPGCFLSAPTLSPEHVQAQCAAATINQPATRSALDAFEHQRKGFAFSCSALRASPLTFELCHYFFKGQKSSQ